MWFQKEDDETVYLDKRKGYINDFRAYTKRGIDPDVQADNCYLPFRNNSFEMTIYDPPHIISKDQKINISQVFGSLDPFSWQKEIYMAVRECLRVLKKGGFLIFKWNDTNKSLRRALSLFPIKPLFGTNTRNFRVQTWWIVFRKD